jgi:hypothetical protein
MVYETLCKWRAGCLGVLSIGSLQCDDVPGKSSASGDFDWARLDGACITKVYDMVKTRYPL